MPVQTWKENEIVFTEEKIEKNLVSLAWAHNCHHKTEIEFKVQL
jgi:hypothetical protein